MFEITEIQNTFFLENESTKYVKFLKTSHDYSVEILDNSLELKENDFQNLIKNSSLKKYKLICRVSELKGREINLLLNLGFDFLGIEYNPETQETEEVYIYKFKEEYLIKDDVLKDILEKLEMD